PKEITLSTTTSTENSGLLKVLNPPFEEKYNVRIKVIPEGTGKALKTAELGGSDVVMVHARSKEDAFVEAGNGINRRDLMHNDFVIIGPASDPAGIKSMKHAAGAFTKIAQSQASFFSRGDDSGTHTKEKAVWKKAGTSTAGVWYKSLGKGMGDTIVAADAQEGYILTDRATYLAMKDKIKLVVLVEGDQMLYNPYGVIAVNPAKYPEKSEKYQLVMLYIGYLTSPEGQRIIAEYGKEEFGQALFYPDAIPTVS
ncbi:MAG: substrate-binding domain-containing protein, partial [Candidatus Hydrothermarchaeota archaeon]|nr:substrate-binding domain-containing protein [Candidatus Hydrothermarchaeota archaeon]